MIRRCDNFLPEGFGQPDPNRGMLSTENTMNTVDCIFWNCTLRYE